MSVNGIGKDYSTIQVIDVSTKPYEQVFVYRRNDISAWNFSEVVFQIATKFNEGFLVIENNSVGKIVADLLYQEYDYDNMLSTKLKGGDSIISTFSMRNIGLRVTKKTKKIGCVTLKTLIEDNFLRINDWETLQELSNFVRFNDSFRADTNKHDDLVMPLVNFGWLTVQSFFEDLTDKNMQALIKEKNEINSENFHTVFGFIT